MLFDGMVMSKVCQNIDGRIKHSKRRKGGRPALEWEKYVEQTMMNRDRQARDWKNKGLWKAKTANP